MKKLREDWQVGSHSAIISIAHICSPGSTQLIDKPSRGIHIAMHLAAPRGGYSVAHNPTIAAYHITSTGTLRSKRMILQAKRSKITLAWCTENDDNLFTLKQPSLREQHFERCRAVIHNDSYFMAIGPALHA